MKARILSMREAGELQQLSLSFTDPQARAWQVRVSPRARRMSVRILFGGHVDIVVPVRTRAHHVEQFVRRHRAWIERKVRDFSPTPHLGSLEVPAEVALPATGRVLPITCRPASGGRPRLHCTPAGLVWKGEPRRAGELRRALRAWLATEARRELTAWLERLARETGLQVARIQIRTQRTRWGSCSPNGTISLNCCLLFQPAAVVRYLLVHELCHTRHMNHSPRFWRLVARHEPDYRALDRALTQGWRNVPAWVFES